jgi:hypothetical protein
MGELENRIDANRHIRQADRQVARQRELIQRLHHLGLPTERADGFLQELIAGLGDHRRGLEEIVRQCDAGYRDHRGNILL